MSAPATCPTCEGEGVVPLGRMEHPNGRDERAVETCDTCEGAGEIATVTYCGTCGNPEDNPDYRKACCTTDNMLTD